MNLDSVDLFVFGTGFGEEGDLNLFCEIKEEGDKISLLRLIGIPPLALFMAKSKRRPKAGEISGGQQLSLF